MYYAIHATVRQTRGKWTSTRQLPTFFLRDDLQGIRDTADAENVARRLLGAYDSDNESGASTMHVTAFQVD